MAQITTMKNSKTNEILYPKTIKSALMNDDGTPLTFSDSGSGLYGDPVSEFENFDPINAQFLGGNAPEYYAAATGLNAKIDKESIINDLTTGGITNVLSAEQGKVIGESISQLQTNMPSIDVSWNAIIEKPTTFAPSDHTQDWSTITGKPTTFTPSTHTHADYIPRSVGGEAPDISAQDLNNIIATGFYKGSGCLNAPPVSNSWIYLTVITHHVSWVYQKVVDLHNPNSTWVRSKLSGTWSAWRASTVRNIIVSTADPTLASMAVGDIWIKV